MDDNFGMAKAIERIRSWPEGDKVPIAIVLTKCDKYHHHIKSKGGPIVFVRKYYPSLINAAGKAKVFESTAITTRRGDREGSSVFRKFSSQGVVEPLRWAMNELNQNERRIQQEQMAKETRKHLEKINKEELANKQKAIKLWTIGWILFVLIFAGVAITAALIVLPE